MDKQKPLAIIILIVGVLLLLVASCIGYYLWWQGKLAAQEAASLLEEHTQITDEGPKIVSALYIPSISLELPVLWEYSEDNLETTVCRYRGPDPGEEGNLVITGHDYLSGAHFGQLDQVDVGDQVTLYSQEGEEFIYLVYQIDYIHPDEVEALEDYDSPAALTLMTCADNANRRLLVKCSPVEV